MTSAPDSRSSNKSLVAKLLRSVFRERRVDSLDALMVSDYREIDPLSGQRQGRDGFKEFYNEVLEAFPDLSWKLQGQVAEDAKVVSWGTWNGTQAKDFLGIPGSNRKARVSMMMVHTIEDGMIVDGLTMVDSYGLLQQLGDIPPPGGTRKHRFGR